jgi:imidazole glycerol phosphate synthase subunit HisF
LAKLSTLVNIPMASEEQGNNNICWQFLEGKADAALAASVFHFKK